MGLYSDLEVSLSFLPLGLCHVTFEGVEGVGPVVAEDVDPSVAGNVGPGVAGDVDPGGVCVSEDAVT